MIIRCWGSRGSVPVSGKKYLRYGGHTTCLEIRTKDNQVLIVDAGTGIREAGLSLLTEQQRELTILLTHAHWDHIIGFPFFKPIYSHKTIMNIWGCPFAQTSIQQMLGRTMEAPNFPISFDAITSKIIYQDSCVSHYTLGSMKISPIALSHPNRGTGYKFEEDGKCFVFLTDNELGHKHEGGLDYADYVEFSRNADLLFHDAEYREDEYLKTRGWGHSCYKDVLNLAMDAGVKTLGLFHHNQERSDDDLDHIVNDCRQMLQKSGKTIECSAIGQLTEFRL